MLEEQEARARMLALCGRGKERAAPVEQAVGGYLWEDVAAVVDSPHFDNSSVDGYALGRTATRGESFPIIGEQAAGPDQRVSLQPGQASRIFTGAPVPAGCAAVVMQEDVRREGGRIVLTDDCGAGENVRTQGSDFRAEEILGRAGTEISPAVLALLISQGIKNTPVIPPPVVGILTCGDELVEPGRRLWPGAVYESNAPMLRALFRRAGVTELPHRHASDDPVALKAAAADLLSRCDFLFTVGGVSVGEKDYTKDALRSLGVEEDFWRIKLKPGKPLLFGRTDRTVVFGLPGNPVSAWTMAVLFGIPCLKAWRGASNPQPGRWIQARVAVPLKNSGDRPHYMRGHLDETGLWRPSGLQRSDALRSLALCDSLARLPENSDLQTGDPITVLL